jgi:hypothetical protein
MKTECSPIGNPDSLTAVCGVDKTNAVVVILEITRILLKLSEANNKNMSASLYQSAGQGVWIMFRLSSSISDTFSDRSFIRICIFVLRTIAIVSLFPMESLLISSDERVSFSNEKLTYKQNVLFQYKLFITYKQRRVAFCNKKFTYKQSVLFQ